jgi:ABC-type branched-chain amino acid transport system, permease component
MTEGTLDTAAILQRRETPRSLSVAFAVTVVLLVAAPFVVYPVFLMKALCFALFACAFNLLIGYVGLVSFGHALYFGWASYLAAHAAKVWALPPELAIVAAPRPPPCSASLPAASPSAARASISP